MVSLLEMTPCYLSAPFIFDEKGRDLVVLSKTLGSRGTTA